MTAKPPTPSAAVAMLRAALLRGNRFPPHEYGGIACCAHCAALARTSVLSPEPCARCLQGYEVGMDPAKKEPTP